MNSDSTATTRLVDVYYVGSLEDVGSFSLELNGLIDANVTSVEFVSDITADKIEYAELPGNDYAIIVGGDTANAVVDGKLKLGTIKIVFPESTGDVDVTVDIDESWVSNAEMGDFSGESFGGYAMDASSLKIVKELVTEPEVTYHDDVTATMVAESTDLLDDPARGYEATVNYANGTVGKLVWSITAAEQTKTVDATAAEVSGQPTVIYGLIIVDANVDKVTDVVLTNVVE
jgi:hypothetical protein